MKHYDFLSVMTINMRVWVKSYYIVASIYLPNIFLLRLVIMELQAITL